MTAANAAAILYGGTQQVVVSFPAALGDAATLIAALAGACTLVYLPRWHWVRRRNRVTHMVIMPPAEDDELDVPDWVHPTQPSPVVTCHDRAAAEAELQREIDEMIAGWERD